MTTSPSATSTLRSRRVKTWSSFGALGRKPNEYEIVTHGMNHTIGATPLEMGAEVHGNRWLLEHRDGIALKAARIDAFRDPDRMTYRKYTQAMDEQETYIDGLLQHYGEVQHSDRALTPAALDLLAVAMAPARYLGHGLQMLSAYVQQLAHSSYLANCAAFQTADQLRRVQRVAYRTRQLADAHPERGFGTAERMHWESDPDWQPTREAIERLLLAFDWDQAFVGLNLVVKPIVDELFLKAFADLAREHGDELDALVAENLYLDAQRSRRWTVDACKALVDADAANAGVLRERLAQWRPYGEKIIASASRLLARHSLATKAPVIADRACTAWSAFIVDTGLRARALKPAPAPFMNPIDVARGGRRASVRLDPDGRSFHCEPGQTVLAAALAAGIDLPYECASGSCGGCRARLLTGAVTTLWANAPGLSERDRCKGDRILCCQSIAQGDCVIQARPADTQPPTPPAPLQARVGSLHSLNRDVVHLVLDAERGVDFLPGQFMLFALQRGIGRRAYSMSNLPNGSGRLEFIVKRKPGGLASAFVFDELKTGDRLDLEGPYGRAWLREDGPRDIVLLAGGSGLAPIWSIAQAALQRSPARRLRLYFGVDRGEDLFWLMHIEQARRAYPGLEAHLVLMHASPHDPAGCRQGAVGGVMNGDVHDLPSCDLYMGGPPGLVDHVMRELVATGRAQADRVFFDRFC